MVIFSKVLSETDIRRRCVVPMEYFKMKCFPKPKLEDSRMVDFKVIDESGHPWILSCSTRNIGDLDHPKHPKPVLIKGWLSFVKSKKLSKGDTVIIYEQKDETGSIHLRIGVEKQTSPPQAPRYPVKNQNPVRNRISISHNRKNESKAISQPLGDLSADFLNRHLGGNTAGKTFSIDEEQTPSPHSSYQQKACYNTEKPSQSLNLELTLKLTMTGGMTAATSSRIDKELAPNFCSTSQGIACNKTETSSLILSLGFTSEPTMTGEQQHACMQETEPRTIDFLRSF
ncbi:hypothetical protein PTKIN_Ptkin06aG0072200 [Pterospermum kingtungense]